MSKRTLVVFTLMLVCVGAVFSDDGYMDDVDYGLVESIKSSNIVAVGTVMTLVGVYRRDVPTDGSGTICTDVLVHVNTMIKGKPNFGENHIKFMVEGGVAYVPKFDKVMSLEISDGVTFKVGEKVLLLLNTFSYPYYDRYPYGNMRLAGWDYGKRLIKDDKVKFIYRKNGKIKRMELPLDLVQGLAKATIKNETAAFQLEDSIKDAARGSSNKLTETVIERLKTDAKRILEEKK